MLTPLDELRVGRLAVIEDGRAEVPVGARNARSTSAWTEKQVVQALTPIDKPTVFEYGEYGVREKEGGCWGGV